MSPKKAKKTKKRKKDRVKREKRTKPKTSLRDQLAALMARVEALEARVEEFCTAPDPAPQSAGDPLTAIPGIGPKYAERLRAAGIASVTDLIEADPETLAEQTGIPRKTIQGWIDVASGTL